MREQTEIRTRDGSCPVSVFHPTGAKAGAGPWPAVIFCMDGLGIRPTLFDMGERLASSGYLVLLPDFFYRGGRYEPLDPKVVLGSPDGRKALAPLLASITQPLAAQDAAAFFDYLDSRRDVKGRKVGTTGYCMGGGISLTLAGHYPDRVAAAASFHGGNLATDQPTSPHLLAPRIKAEVYVAGADKDNSYPVEMEKRLDKALTDAGVKHRCEIYPEALHGWTMKDFPVYNEAAAERHWQELTALYARTLN